MATDLLVPATTDLSLAHPIICSRVSFRIVCKGGGGKLDYPNIIGGHDSKCPKVPFRGVWGQAPPKEVLGLCSQINFSSCDATP